MLTVRDVAAQLKLSTATIYTLVESGALPHVRILNSIRISREALTAFVESTQANPKEHP